MKRFTCKTEADTARLGARLAHALAAPACVALYGDLGSGKTALVQGIGGALGIAGITSPTFTIVHEYDSVPPLLHFDAYRLSDGDALLDIGFADYLDRDAILCVEWAELVEDALPVERLNVTIVGSGADARTIELASVGARYERMVDALC